MQGKFSESGERERFPSRRVTHQEEKSLATRCVVRDVERNLAQHRKAAAEGKIFFQHRLQCFAKSQRDWTRKKRGTEADVVAKMF